MPLARLLGDGMARGGEGSCTYVVSSGRDIFACIPEFNEGTTFVGFERVIVRMGGLRWHPGFEASSLSHRYYGHGVRLSRAA